eukprot:m.340589 g.340589  ORF g.340589 m.340589 type:complete len:308 (-) comp19400_c0_seq1:35-958(-)
MAIFPVSQNTARVVEAILIVTQLAAGFLHSQPAVWGRALVDSFLMLTLGTFLAAGVLQVICYVLGKAGLAYLIQTQDNAQPTLYRKEITDTLYGFGLVVAPMMAWPLANHRLGMETALRGNLSDCVIEMSFVEKGSQLEYALQFTYYLIKMTIGLFAADAFNYWKHRYFHHPILWAFHKTHHSHHNPSCFAGYAVSPMYAFATFFPVYFFAYPELGLYVPIHWPLLVFYLFLNFYLHCGYVIRPIEAVLSPLYVMSSEWHNVHHEKGRVGFNYKPQTFGEMLLIWDLWMGTHAEGHYKYAGSKNKST